ncbi:uncharacterized protein TrAtP1_004948 [Trichoderma atroviride]|uniref:uncharacterized protein n=1 Tax=Hypocrea atroviridis TaxID=63577 RepID=UPI00331C39CF|nr:hypothetical protein TrAtP1_004948 [Trichoderma atroviride]
MPSIYRGNYSFYSFNGLNCKFSTRQSSKMASPPPPPPFSSSISLSLTLRFARPASRSEITAVGISPSSTIAYAIYAGAQTDQPWIDTFDLRSQTSYSKIIGCVAAFSPKVHSSPSSPSRLRISTITSRSSPASASTSASLTPASSSSALPRIATLSATLIIRDFSSSKPILELKDVASPIAWSPDGRSIAAAEPRHRIGVWDVRTGTRTGRVPGHIAAVTHVAFMPDSHLVTTSRDGTLRVTNPVTMKTLYKLEIESSSTNPPCLGRLARWQHHCLHLGHNRAHLDAPARPAHIIWPLQHASL